MSSEIIIFQSPEDSGHDVKDHREIEQEKLLNDLGQDNAIHVDFLLNMTDAISSEKSFWITSNIQSIIAKQILLYCHPIIKEVPYKKSKNAETNNAEESKDFFIQVQLNYTVIAYMADNLQKFIIIPAETPFRIVGFKTSPLMLPHLDYSTIAPAHPYITDVRELFRAGTYSYELNRRNINGTAPYTQQLIPIINDDYSMMPKFDNAYIVFKDKDDAKLSMDTVLKKILLLRTYFSRFLPFFMSMKLPKPIQYKLELQKPENKMPNELKDVVFNPYASANGLKESLIGEGILTLYNRMKKLGSNNPDIQSAIKNKQLENQIKKNRIAKARDLSMQIVDDFRKQAIVNRKFPNKKFINLNDKEKEMVMREYELLNKKAKFVRDKDIRAKVTAFLRSFGALNTADALQKSYDDIKALIDEKKINTLDIGLCDHYIDHAEIMLKMYKDKTIYKARSAFDIREYLIKKYTDSASTIDDDYYCKICGQVIASDSNAEVSEYAGDQKLNTGQEFDSLEELVYRDVSHIVRTFIKFKNLVDVRTIIKSMVASLTPEMHVIETKLKQIQTNISDDMKDLMDMYIYIYAFALVSHMIYVNYGQITFAFREGALGGGLYKRKNTASKYIDNESSDEDSNIITSGNEIITGGNESGESIKDRLQNILKNALYLINSTKVKLLKASNNIGPDKVKPILLQAYQWVLRLQTYRGVESKDIDIDREILNSVTSSSVYQYLYTVTSILHPKTNEGDLKSIIGTDLETIKINNYKSKKDKINPFRDVKILTLDGWKKTGNKFYDEYTYGSYLNTIDYEKNEIYRNFATPPSEQLQAHYESQKKLLLVERRLRFQSRFSIWGAFNVIARTFHYPVAEKVKYNISKYYKPDGSKRQWNVMVLTDGTEVDFDALMKLDFAKRLSLKIKDRKDGDEYLSELKNYSSTINAKFEQQDFNKSLLEYFENRCPLGGIHEFSGSNICNKCTRNMDTSWIHSPDAEKYVTQHATGFNKHDHMKLNIIRHNLEKIKKLTTPKEYVFQKFPVWEYSEVQILEWSRVNTKVNINMLLNLGCSEQHKYLLIEKERDSPIKTYNNINHLGRISKLDSYYNTTIRDYYSVKNYQLSDLLPLYYKDLIEKYKTEILKLPDLDDIEYDKKLDWYKITHSNENQLVCNFILVQLANIMIYIAKSSVAGHALAEALTFSLIHKERLLSKPDPYKISLDKRPKDDEYQSNSSSDGNDIDDDIGIESASMSEADSDINDQNIDTEAYGFDLDNTAIDDVNDGNDDDEGGTGSGE